MRAEHDVGERWIVMAIRYDDEYQRVDGQWLFARRGEWHWFAADLLECPQQVDFDSWHTSSETPALRGHAPTWGDFDTPAVTARP